MNSAQIAAQRRARYFAGVYFVVTALLMTVVTGRMLETPESVTAGTMLLGPLAYFAAVAIVLFFFPRQLPGWAVRLVPLTVHGEFRAFFGIRQPPR